MFGIITRKTTSGMSPSYTVPFTGLILTKSSLFHKLYFRNVILDQIILRDNCKHIIYCRWPIMICISKIYDLNWKLCFK